MSGVASTTVCGLYTGRAFGRHIRSLRRARGMTQEVLAERCGLSADTIRRLEHGSFSPSLDTLRKLVRGLDLVLSTLFEGYELDARKDVRELIELLSSRRSSELAMVTRILRALFHELDGVTASRSAYGQDDDVDDDVGVTADPARTFGRHVRLLRRARGMTQEVLAARCGLSADTIRRLEHGAFDPAWTHSASWSEASA